MIARRWREIINRQLDRNLLLRAIGGFEKIEARIGDFYLARPGAILRVTLAADRREAGKRVKHRGFARAARADDSAFQFELLQTLKLGIWRTAVEVPAVMTLRRLWSASAAASREAPGQSGCAESFVPSVKTSCG